MKKKISLLVIFTFLVSSMLFAQKKFSVVIHFPKELNIQKVHLSYDNGEIVKDLPFVVNHQTISASGEFFYTYATLFIKIDSNWLEIPLYTIFYLNSQPAIITFNLKTKSPSHIKSITLKNAIGEDNIDRQFEKYTAPERQAFEDFQSDTTVNDSSFILNQMLVRKWVNKKLEFIRLHKEEYYSFRLFRTDIAPNFFMNPDSLLHFYKNNFPANQRNSLEGKEIMQILHGRKIASSENMQAPDFKITDINGKRIELKDYKGKYVLINFWASWCVPCIAELPTIKKINAEYFSGNLAIITNTLDQDSSAFLNALKKYKMTKWINVYRDFVFTRKFGGASAIPQLFLIDPNGIIIYNRSYKKVDDEKLTRLNQILKDRISSGKK